MRQYSFQFLLFLLLALPLTAAAGEWVKLDGAKLKKGSYSDGDSFHVVHKGKEYVFRLFYVDTPETDKSYPDRVRGQAQYFSISAEEVIQVGVDAADFTQKFLKGTFTVYTDWSDGWGRGTRYRAIIQKDGVDLGSTLVSEGLARASGFVPDSPWPGYDGSVWDYRNYLNTLKDTAEKNGVGAWGKSRTKNSATTPSASATVEKSADGRIDLNSASQSELESLPRIGPVLAQRITAARPFFSMDELDQVVGISSKTIEVLLSYALVLPPPIQPNTALYFKENVRYYLNSQVRVSIQSLEPLSEWAPEGFDVAEADTSNEGIPGGHIRLYAPENKMAIALQRFKESNTPMDVMAWLRDYEGEAILVVY